MFVAHRSRHLATLRENRTRRRLLRAISSSQMSASAFQRELQTVIRAPLPKSPPNRRPVAAPPGAAVTGSASDGLSSSGSLSRLGSHSYGSDDLLDDSSEARVQTEPKPPAVERPSRFVHRDQPSPRTQRQAAQLPSSTTASPSPSPASPRGDAGEGDGEAVVEDGNCAACRCVRGEGWSRCTNRLGRSTAGGFGSVCTLASLLSSRRSSLP